MNVRRTLEQLESMAVNEVGFCVGIYWKSVTGSCVPDGMISARCRVAYVLFSGFYPANRFYNLLAQQRVDRLPKDRVRDVQVTYAGTTITGVAVPTVISPDHTQATGFHPAPHYTAQRGYQRYFQRLAWEQQPTTAWWDDPDPDYGVNDDRFTREPEPLWSAVDAELERDLDRIEAAYDEKLWWYGVPGQRTKYPPALGSVQELFAYARRKELDPEEVARRNLERKTNAWLIAQHARERARQQELDTDHAEIAAALATPRRGRAYATDRAWLDTAQTLRTRKALKVLYRDAGPRPRRSRSAA